MFKALGICEVGITRGTEVICTLPDLSSDRTANWNQYSGSETTGGVGIENGMELSNFRGGGHHQLSHGGVTENCMGCGSQILHNLR